MTRRHLLRTAPALLALALVLAACSSPPEGEAEHMLWFANDLSDWDHSRYEAISPVPYSGELTVEDLLDALLDGPPLDSGLRSPFPAGTRLLGWQLDQDGLLWVDLSESYGSLTGIGLTLADYCLTFTLCQLEEVERAHHQLPLPPGAGPFPGSAVRRGGNPGGGVRSAVLSPGRRPRAGL